MALMDLLPAPPILPATLWRLPRPDKRRGPSCRLNRLSQTLALSAAPAPTVLCCSRLMHRSNEARPKKHQAQHPDGTKTCITCREEISPGPALPAS
jgi:hypothetical protein